MSAGLLPGYTWDEFGMLKDGARLPDSLVRAGEMATSPNGVIEHRVLEAGSYTDGSHLRNCVIMGTPPRSFAYAHSVATSEPERPECPLSRQAPNTDAPRKTEVTLGTGAPYEMVLCRCGYWVVVIDGVLASHPTIWGRIR